MRFVTDILTNVFELSPEIARATMMIIHELGAAPVGVFETADAQERRARARELAFIGGMPLRITLTNAG